MRARTLLPLLAVTLLLELPTPAEASPKVMKKGDSGNKNKNKHAEGTNKHRARTFFSSLRKRDQKDTKGGRGGAENALRRQKRTSRSSETSDRARARAPRRLEKDLHRDRVVRMRDGRGDTHRIARERVTLASKWKKVGERLERTQAEVEILSLVRDRDGNPALRVRVYAERSRATADHQFGFPTEATQVPPVELTLKHNATYALHPGVTAMQYVLEGAPGASPATAVTVTLGPDGRTRSVTFDKFKGLSMRSHTVGGDARMSSMALAD